MKKKNFTTFTIYLTFAIVSLLTFTQCDNSKAVEKALQERAKLDNKEYPIFLDAFTRIDSSTVAEGKIYQYNYAIMEVDPKIIEDFKAKTIPEIKGNIKKNPFYQSFRENDVTVRFIYRDTLGVEVFRCDVTPEDYR